MLSISLTNSKPPQTGNVADFYLYKIPVDINSKCRCFLEGYFSTMYLLSSFKFCHI